MEEKKQLLFVIDRIRKLRGEKGMSQMELSNRANLSQSFLASIEAGKKQPSVLTIIKIANALEVSPKLFFQESETKTKQQIKDEIANLLELL
ncbi:helix-turn-helix transcriptional regulator [Brucepastera parasyntrophica]|uniref:helix-turn-helix domain-containing protein n=1 Tax=Brucepastera parasyntrophica TaxID=2880008 RepID=UPI00210E49F7|nr:helix-turn-helix transcriptional regulator [Brucepastera parasyntrophica]ULQ59178.1 helix-turn-helix transcriptional regulator [Brucepastera parasyntrophica]